MPYLDYYRLHHGASTMDAAFEAFEGTLQNYYDAAYYVDWAKVYQKAGMFERELALLSTLCKKPDKPAAARDLLREYPQVIRALPALLACRGSVTIMEEQEKARVTTYDFTPLGLARSEEQADRYAQFLAVSGLIELLERINSVPDYVTGVEVGMDTNGRKNRSGDCAVKAVRPIVEQAALALQNVQIKNEANHRFLCDKGFCLPKSMNRVKWDWALWTVCEPRRLVVMEVNHYGSSGSKPEKTALEYVARQPELDNMGIGYVWVTDGLGWLDMRPTLRAAFEGVRYLMTIRLAREGLLKTALRHLLAAEEVAIPLAA